jgi:hypothetical protein
MAKQSKRRTKKENENVQIYAGMGIIITLIAFVLFVLTPQLNNLNLGAITSPPASEYRVPVGGTVTLKYIINTWNGVVMNWADMDRYQYNYDIINRDTGLVVARGASYLQIHENYPVIVLQMNREGTFNYTLKETVVFLQEGGRIMNGTSINFKVIVGNGINPTPTPTPAAGTGGTITIVTDPVEEVTIIQAPEPKITFVSYNPGVTPTPVGVIKITPAPITTTPKPQVTTTPRPTTTVSNDDSSLTFVPAATDTQQPETKTTSGFEIGLVLIALLILVWGRKGYGKL